MRSASRDRGSAASVPATESTTDPHHGVISQGVRDLAAGRPAEDISAREVEVLGLLGEHLTNAEIAAKLFISVRTVESHVSSLLRKLEVPDRRVLAQRAAEYADPGAAGRTRSAPLLPEQLTSFVGR